MYWKLCKSAGICAVIIILSAATVTSAQASTDPDKASLQYRQEQQVQLPAAAGIRFVPEKPPEHGHALVRFLLSSGGRTLSHHGRLP